MSLEVNGYAVGLLPLVCRVGLERCKTSYWAYYTNKAKELETNKKFTFFAHNIFFVGWAPPPNTAGPRSIAVSATMVVMPLRECNP